MSVRPDFAKMNGKQLVAAYNEYTGKDRKSVFPNAATGRKAVEKAYADWLKTQPAEAAPVKPGRSERARAKKAGSTRRSRDGRIVIVAAQNPHREGSNAYDHFAKARESETVAAYLARFEEGKARKTAGQWLSNFARWGSVRIAFALDA